jgi:hypothetical protein
MLRRWRFNMADVLPLIKQAEDAARHIRNYPGLYFVCDNDRAYLISSASPATRNGRRRQLFPDQQAETKRAASEVGADSFAVFIPLSICALLVTSQAEQISIAGLDNGAVSLRGLAANRAIVYRYILFKSPVLTIEATGPS